MPLIQQAFDVAAGATVENLLAGSTFEFLPYDAILDIAIVEDGNARARVTVHSGADVLMEEGVPSQANRVPVNPDDFNLHDVIEAGARLKIRVRNTDGANPCAGFYAINITPAIG